MTALARSVVEQHTGTGRFVHAKVVDAPGRHTILRRVDHCR